MTRIPRPAAPSPRTPAREGAGYARAGWRGPPPCDRDPLPRTLVCAFPATRVGPSPDLGGGVGTGGLASMPPAAIGNEGPGGGGPWARGRMHAPGHGFRVRAQHTPPAARPWAAGIRHSHDLRE